MGRLILISFFLSFFVVGSILPAYARIKPHENPVHKKRQKAYEKNKEVYKGDGERAVEEVPKAKDVKGKDKQDKDPRLERFMKEFDKDEDGVISYEEMESAKAAKKDGEMRALLDKEKAKRERQKAEEQLQKTTGGGQQ